VLSYPAERKTFPIRPSTVRLLTLLLFMGKCNRRRKEVSTLTFSKATMVQMKNLLLVKAGLVVSDGCMPMP